MNIWSVTTGVVGARHVVLVHGSLDRSAGLLKLSRRLDRLFRVTRYDRRGYGRSCSHTGPFSMPAQVDDLASVIRNAVDALGPSIVVGHSYGGNVALAAAECHPGLIGAVVTYESPLSWEPWWPQDSAGGDAMAWRDDPEEAAERFMRRLIGDDRWDRLPLSSRTARRAEGPAMVDELSDLRRHAPWTSERVGVPVLVLHGEHGHAHHRTGSETLASMLPDAELRTVPSARHFGPNTHPDLIADLIADFADRVVA